MTMTVMTIFPSHHTPSRPAHPVRRGGVGRRLVSAFTLVEIMVAMAIFSLVVAAIFTTWELVLKATATGQTAALQAQRERITMRALEESLTCVQAFQASLKYYTFIVANGNEPVLSYTSRLPDVFPRNGKFPGLNLRRLTFQLEAGDDSKKNLVLRQSPVLMDMDADEQNYPLILARDVKSFEVDCWDTNQAQFVTEWDNTNSIPALVRVTLTLSGNQDTGGGVPDQVLTRDIAVPSAMLPSGYQAGRNGNTGNNPSPINQLRH